MKALILEGINEKLICKETEMPVLQSGEVLVKVAAAAVNHRDLWIQKGQYAGLKFPIILGSDGCGTVEAVADEVHADWIGKEVVINPSMNWGSNPRVQQKEYAILGLPDNGTFAQYVKVRAKQLHAKPEHLNAAQAAAIPLAGLTAYRALVVRARARAGETVLITGIGGGVALFALQFAVAMGCNVYVTSGSDEKIKRAIELGAKGGINYKTTDWHKTLVQESGGFDAIVDGACGDTFAKLTEVAKPGGRIVFYGATLGAFNSGVPAKIFWKQLDILGSTMGNDEEFAEMIQLVANYKIIPVVDSVFKMNEASNALEKMEQSSQFGKLVIQID